MNLQAHTPLPLPPLVHLPTTNIFYWYGIFHKIIVHICLSMYYKGVYQAKKSCTTSLWDHIKEFHYLSIPGFTYLSFSHSTLMVFFFTVTIVLSFEKYHITGSLKNYKLVSLSSSLNKCHWCLILTCEFIYLKVPSNSPWYEYNTDLYNQLS